MVEEADEFGYRHCEECGVPLAYDESPRCAECVAVVVCEGCGLPYNEFNLDVLVPDDQWAQLVGRTDGGGILCAACIVKRGSHLPGVTVAKMVFE